MTKREHFFQLVRDRAIIVGIYFVALLLMLYGSRVVSFLPVKKSPGLHIYIFADVIDTKLFEEFEKKTGVPVNVTYFDVNEEMFAKFMINKGYGYDLVMASDYMIKQMVDHKLVQKIDKKKINSFHELDARLLSPEGDEHNDYAIPIIWTPTGIGYSKKFFGELESPSLKMFFDPEWKNNPESRHYTVTMPDDPRDTMIFASLYLYGSSKLVKEHLHPIKSLIIEQKKWIQSFTNSSLSYYLQAEIVPMVLCWAAFMKDTLKEYPDDFGFVLPKEGALYSVEHLLISQASEKKEQAEQLIDFLISSPVAVRNFEETGFNSSNRKSYDLVEPAFADNRAFYPTDSMFKKLHRLEGQALKDDLIDFWIEIKGS